MILVPDVVFGNITGKIVERHPGSQADMFIIDPTQFPIHLQLTGQLVEPQIDESLQIFEQRVQVTRRGESGIINRPAPFQLQEIRFAFQLIDNDHLLVAVSDDTSRQWLIPGNRLPLVVGRQTDNASHARPASNPLRIITDDLNLDIAAGDFNSLSNP